MSQCVTGTRERQSSGRKAAEGFLALKSGGVGGPSRRSAFLPVSVHLAPVLSVEGLSSSVSGSWWQMPLVGGGFPARALPRAQWQCLGARATAGVAVC